MVQLNVVSGKTAGTVWTARRFPVHIGREEASDLRFEEDGIWDQHLVLGLDRNGFLLRVAGNALARVNGHPVVETQLRNGDTIELGPVKLQFWLTVVRQRRLRISEALSWGVILAVGFGQIGILYWLLR